MCYVVPFICKALLKFFSGKGRCMFEKNLPFTYWGITYYVSWPGGLFHCMVGSSIFHNQISILTHQNPNTCPTLGYVFSFPLHVMGIVRSFQFSFFSCQLKKTLVSKLQKPWVLVLFPLQQPPTFIILGNKVSNHNSGGNSTPSSSWGNGLPFMVGSKFKPYNFLVT